MDCSKIEQWMSEFVEESLPAEEMEHVTKHLETCPECSSLLSEIRSSISLCQSYPTLEMDPDFVEKILLRTSGRPRTRSFKERWNRYFLRPLLTPRFAMGASLATLFLILMGNLLIPRLPTALSALSPQELLRMMDHGVSQLYGEGLKAYEKKNEWQAQFSRFKSSAWNSLRSVMDQINGPVEGRKKSHDDEPQKENAPKERSSGLWLFPA
jgi:hypothetical protein